MLICPSCRSKNPQHHNFCQSCGRSLQHNVCQSCGSAVDFSAQTCSQCQAPSGIYWWATIELISVADQANSDSDITTIGALDLAAVAVPPATSAPSLTLNEVEDPWSATEEIATDEPLSSKKFLISPTIVQLDELETDDPWAAPLGQTSLATARSAGTSAIGSQPTHGMNLAPTDYLDDRQRYRLLDPVAIQLLEPHDCSQVRVLDRQPFSQTSLEILMEQEPVTLDSQTVNRKPEDYRQWQFWNAHGIPKVAQAYIALQVSLPGTVPAIHDGWDDGNKTITVVEDRSNWTQLAERWNDPQVPVSQTIYWLDYTLRLWVALSPWQMRQSLLEISNLLLDEDGTLCFQRLFPEQVGIKLQLTDLAQSWKTLFERAQLPPSPPLMALIQSVVSGEIERVEEVRSRLQQIAYELEPKQLSAPLQSVASGDLSAPPESYTMAVAQKLLGLEDAAATHTGRKRDHNEDCFGVLSKIERHITPKGQTLLAKGLYVLCDGMGGHAGGEIASAMTVDLLRDYFARQWGDTLPDEQTIRAGIVSANEAVYRINEQNSAHGSGRMGTTLVLVLVQDHNIAVAHVGDSRCYGVTPTQGLIQLTLDHEVGQQDILRGVDPDIAYGRPDSYQLTQAIGPRDRHYIAPDIRFFELQEDTLLLLASDGLTDNQLLENYWLTNVAPLLASNANLQEGVDRLIDFANEYNGHDNITAIVVRANMG